jgi:hypothetical protein
MQGIIGPEHRGATAPVRGSWQERVEDKGLQSSKKAMARNLDRLVAGSVLEVIEQQGAWHEVEVRHPLMDVDIVEFGFAVKPRSLVAGRCHKWLLRRAMVERLPAEVTERIETTEFSCLFTREESLVERLPPGCDWRLAQLGVADAGQIDRRLTGAYSRNVTFEMIRLWWLETFIRGNFQSGRRAYPSKGA